jgi:hypothetical protein
MATQLNITMHYGRERYPEHTGNPAKTHHDDINEGVSVFDIFLNVDG